MRGTIGKEVLDTGLLGAFVLTALCMAVSGPATAQTGSEEWPQWRGVHRDGVSRDTGLLSSWPPDGPPIVWRATLGEGFSSIAVADGRAYTMFASGVDEYALALDAATGVELWRSRIDSKFENGTGNGSRSTPTVHGDLVYVMSARGMLYALRLDDGATEWRHNLRKLFGSTLQSFGFSSSPLIEEDLLILQVGGTAGHSIAAMDKRTGEVKWTTHSDEAGYSSPIAVTANGVRQIICLSAKNLLSLNPHDGQVYWQYRFDETIPIATPMLLPGNRIFLSASYDKGAAMVRMKGADSELSVEELWTDRGMKNWINGSVLQNGYIYGFDNSILKCISADTGEMMWRHRGFGRGSLVLADGNLIVLSEDGEVVLIEATPDEYRQNGSFRAFNGKCWTAPAMAAGKLFIRSEAELIAVDLRGPAGT